MKILDKLYFFFGLIGFGLVLANLVVIVSFIRVIIANVFGPSHYTGPFYYPSISPDVLQVLILSAGILCFLFSFKLKEQGDYKELLIGFTALLSGFITYLAMELIIHISWFLFVMILFPLGLLYFRYYKNVDFKLSFIPVLFFFPIFVAPILLVRNSLKIVKRALGNIESFSKRVKVIVALILIITLATAYVLIEPEEIYGNRLQHFQTNIELESSVHGAPGARIPVGVSFYNEDSVTRNISISLGECVLLETNEVYDNHEVVSHGQIVDGETRHSFFFTFIAGEDAEVDSNYVCEINVHSDNTKVETRIIRANIRY